MSPEQRLLQAAGLETTVLDSGCCGLAGSFGYEAEHHAISMQIGEQALLPQVREAAPETIIVSDGFSCRQQIAHGTPRRAMHTAEVLHMALETPGERTGGHPFAETGSVQSTAPYPVMAALAVGVGILGAGLYLLKQVQRRD